MKLGKKEEVKMEGWFERCNTGVREEKFRRSRGKEVEKESGGGGGGKI